MRYSSGEDTSNEIHHRSRKPLHTIVRIRNLAQIREDDTYDDTGNGHECEDERHVRFCSRERVVGRECRCHLSTPQDQC